MSASRRVSFFYPGVVLLIGGFLIYLRATPLLVAAGVTLMALGLLMVIQGVRQLHPLQRYAVILVVAVFLILEDANLWWDVERTVSNDGAAATYNFPFMAVSAPWYVVGDLAIYLTIVAAVLLFYAGWGLGRLGRRLA